MPTPAAAGERPESLQAYAERRIKAAVATGAIEPGSRLSPHLLAPQFGLSHIPIREALASLAAAGYVDHQRGRGYMARSLTSKDLVEIYHWRQVLEREACAAAVPCLTDGDIAEMRRLTEQMSTLTASADRFEYVRLSREFHFVVFRRAGAPRLLRFLVYLWDAAAPYSILEMTDSSASHTGHVLSLLPAFEARDTEAVIAAMDSHRSIRVAHVARWEAEQRSPTAARAAGAAPPPSSSQPKA